MGAQKFSGHFFHSYTLCNDALDVAFSGPTQLYDLPDQFRKFSCWTFYTCSPEIVYSLENLTSLMADLQGILTNETRCLWCETVTARDETFFDLSLDIEQNSSITSCLKNFSSTETLNAEDKFFCDKCCR